MSRPRGLQQERAARILTGAPARCSRPETAMTKTDTALDALHTEERESALTFPCTFPIKIMGRTQDGFAQAIAEVVRKHAPDFDPSALEMRASKEGNWLSFTATINANSRQQLDDLYRELVGHPMVKMVL
jgi:putative lipoic acid-binding regulatory protein